MKILGPVSDVLDAIPLSEVASTPRYVDHGTDANVARPAGTRPVIWRGSVEPVNMVNGDEWEQEGVSYQPLDSDLTAIADLDSGVAGALVTDGSGWIKKTYAQLKSSLGLVKADVGLANVDNTSDVNKPISSATQTALNSKAPLASPTFTGTVSGITKSMVGLANVDNTSDANKPVSSAQQTALNAKAPLASPTFTGTVSGITKSMVGLANVDNTSDANKPVSSAQQTALNARLNKAGDTLTGNLAFDRYSLSKPNIDSYMEKAIALGSVSGAVNLDLSQANHFNATITGTTTLSFTNVPAARSGVRLVPVTIRLYMAAVHAVTWPSGTDWGGAGAPSFVVGHNIFTFWLDDTVWFAMPSWQS